MTLHQAVEQSWTERNAQAGWETPLRVVGTSFGTVTIPVSTEDTGTKSVGATELCSAQGAGRHWEHRRLQRRKSSVVGTRISSINTIWMEPEKKVENKQMWDVKTGFKDKPEAGSRILRPHKAEAVSPIQQGMK